MILDILVAFDQETIDVNYKELHEKGIIIADSKFNPKNPEDSQGYPVCGSIYRNCH